MRHKNGTPIFGVSIAAIMAGPVPVVFKHDHARGITIACRVLSSTPGATTISDNDLDGATLAAIGRLSIGHATFSIHGRGMCDPGTKTHRVEFRPGAGRRGIDETPQVRSSPADIRPGDTLAYWVGEYGFPEFVDLPAADEEFVIGGADGLPEGGPWELVDKSGSFADHEGLGVRTTRTRRVYRVVDWRY